MIIKMVKLYNFSSYAGEVTIDLTTDAEKTVVLVGGNNGAGKTSLFTAIKLALYGPQCFRFQDKNNQYTAKIKGLINHDAYLAEKVNSFVEVELNLPTNHQETQYTIRRAWTYENKKLNEEYFVLQDGTPLGEKDLDFLQNYLFAIIPPNLFDFFFFDGEEIGDFFSTNSYNSYIKNAVLTLCGYDVFSTIKHFCDSYVGVEEDNLEYDQVKNLVIEAERKLVRLKNRKDHLLKIEEELSQHIESDNSALDAVQEKFERAGGLSEKDRHKLVTQKEKADKIRADKTKRIRDFVETLMPIYITGDLAQKANQQLQNERAIQQYQVMKELLSPALFGTVLKELEPNISKESPDYAEKISAGVIEKLKPSVDIEHFEVIHDLSREQESQVVSAVLQLKSFRAKDIIAACKDKKRYSEDSERIAQRLRDALPEIDAASHLEMVTRLSSQIMQYEESLQSAKQELVELETEIGNQTGYCERLRNSLQAKAKNKTAYLYTGKISKVMERMIRDVTNSKFKQIESLTLKMFSKIIRKNNFLQMIELDEKFNVNLYKRQDYTVGEIGVLLRNVGLDAMERRLGSKGIKELLRALNLQDKKEILLFFSNLEQSTDSDQIVHLYNRIEMNQLSKGEKQVFVLSLYWAIIKTSGQSVPFIIDTPFARIDTEHREQISKLFFPDISQQVIILSTDEEVAGPYYNVLRPYISHEYMLEYIVEENKTVVHSGYFKEAIV